MNTLIRILLSLALATLLSCTNSDSLSGTYVHESKISSTNTMEIVRYKFSSDGKVLITSRVGGQTVELGYLIEDGYLKIDGGEGGKMVMKILDDGTIEGPMGSALRKE